MFSNLNPFLVAVVVIAFSMDSALSGHSEEDTGLSPNEVFSEKWRVIFNIIDGDEDGLFSLENEFAFALKLIDYYHPSEDLIPDLMQFWLLFKDVIKAYPGADTRKTALNQSEYVMAHRWYWNNHLDLFNHRLYRFYTALFHAIDSDDDGFISFDEFKFAYKIYGDSAAINKKTKEVFELIDSDGDGNIGEDEFRDTHIKYFLDPHITAKELPLY